MIIKHVPNALTSLNLASGCISIVFALDGHLQTAAIFILAAALLDFLDGFAARLLKAWSPIGKELDSLADIVSFGVAPGMILFQFMSDLSLSTGSHAIWAWLAFLIPVFSALRLAKFNLDERQTAFFIGLPTPANAIFWSFGVAYTYSKLIDFAVNPLFIVPIICLSAWLLVSEIPMFSLKFKRFNWNENKQSYVFLTCCLIVIVLFGLAGLSACILLYIVLSIFYPGSVKKEK